MITGILTFEAADISGILTCIGNVFDDVKLLIILAIGIPLAFYIIKKVIEISAFKKDDYFEREEREYQKVLKITKEKDVRGLEKWLEKWRAGKIKF